MDVTTVCGPIPPTALGPTLMHEHLVFGYPGYEADSSMWSIDPAGLVDNACRAVATAQRGGFRSLIDVTPNDCGRNPELLREVSQRTGMTILCATGYYFEGSGASAYFQFRGLFTDIVAELTELMITELTDGINGTGIRAGVIKVGTSKDEITPYEQALIKAAAAAQQATGAPIITHTEAGTMGPEQARLLVAAGADPAKTVVGHMCGNATDLDYQLATLATGVGIGIDRIGLNNMFNSITDDHRMAAIVALTDRGYLNRIFLSHDTVNNWLGRDASGFTQLPGTRDWAIDRISTYIRPGLIQRGLSDQDIDTMLVGNITRLWGAP